MKTLDAIVLTLVIIGAINWGLVGLFNFDLVAFLFGNMTVLARIIYISVAVAGIFYSILLFRQDECTPCQY